MRKSWKKNIYFFSIYLKFIKNLKNCFFQLKNKKIRWTWSCNTTPASSSSWSAMTSPLPDRSGGWRCPPVAASRSTTRSGWRHREASTSRSWRGRARGRWAWTGAYTLMWVFVLLIMFICFVILLIVLMVNNIKKTFFLNFWKIYERVQS